MATLILASFGVDLFHLDFKIPLLINCLVIVGAPDPKLRSSNLVLAVWSRIGFIRKPNYSLPQFGFLDLVSEIVIGFRSTNQITLHVNLVFEIWFSRFGFQDLDWFQIHKPNYPPRQFSF